jgi:hypothetical protein
MTPRPPIPAPPHRGSCLCGAARYVLEARPRAVNACHCTDCKKLTGATNLLMVLADRSAFRHESGAVARYRKRADSGREIDIVSCEVCGVRLWHESLASPQWVFITAGTLDDWHWAVPTSHIWTQRVSPGVTFQPDALLVAGQPTARELLFDAFDHVYNRLA